jgi:DnaJ-class molecular chaperone
MINHYKILGVNRDASLKEITRAFRKMALKYHPDRNGSSDSAIRFKGIYDAYKVLRDASARAEYDYPKSESETCAVPFDHACRLDRDEAWSRAREGLLKSDPFLYDKAASINLSSIADDLREALDDMKSQVSGAKKRKQSLREEISSMSRNLREDMASIMNRN